MAKVNLEDISRVNALKCPGRLEVERMIAELKASRALRDGLEYAYHACTSMGICEVCELIKKYDRTVAGEV